MFDVKQELDLCHGLIFFDTLCDESVFACLLLLMPSRYLQFVTYRCLLLCRVDICLLFLSFCLQT